MVVEGKIYANVNCDRNLNLSDYSQMLA